MKRVGYLFEQIVSVENLYLAESKARKGKLKKSGIKSFVENLDDNILLLNEELSSGSYSTGEYHHFTINEPKVRHISSLGYKHRIVHHAIVNVLEPYFLNSFVNTTYSCIKGRGIHKCLTDLNLGFKDKENSTYCLKIDVKKFYPSVNHSILIRLLKRKFKDVRLMNLLESVITSIEGLPLGSYTSQWFGNFYLSAFDHWLKQEKKVKFYRYCDDIVILHYDKKYLHRLRTEIQDYLLVNLELELSNYQVFPTSKRGIDFVGYVSCPTHIKLRKSIKTSFKKMLDKYPNRKSKASYKGWLAHGNCKNLCNRYLK